MKLSAFGEKFTRKTGILELMEDIALASGASTSGASTSGASTSGASASGESLCMLGGGNPARIPQLDELWRRRIGELSSDAEAFGKLIGAYDSADGIYSFRVSLAASLHSQYGWDIGPEHICVTNGSQVSMFYLFNLFSGPFASGHKRRIVFPLMPEYVGYADQALAEDAFLSLRPRLELRGAWAFKYFIDFDKLEALLKREGSSIGALCVSRPTNPSGNVLTDSELRRLAALADEYAVPLIVDNAYGYPFPGIIFTDTEPYWDANCVLSMSLSKLGLPSLRTGIVIAQEELIKALSSVNAIAALATGTFGQAIVEPLIVSGELLALSSDVVRPYYLEKRKKTLTAIEELFTGLPLRHHESEGAIFLWLWFDDERVDTRILYRRLKERRVLVLPGEYFSFGTFDDGTPCASWEHPRRCIRINYAGPPDQVYHGLEIIAQELRSMLAHG